MFVYTVDVYNSTECNILQYVPLLVYSDQACVVIIMAIICYVEVS